MDSYTTKDLVDKCLKNDMNAQRYLYNTYSRQLFAIILRYFDDVDDAEDVMIETIQLILTKMYTYSKNEDEKVFFSWMKRIAVNKSLSKIRYDKAHKKESRMEDRLQSIAGDDIIEHKLNAEYLLKLIQGLTPQLRIVFNLYAIEGYSHKEISKMLGISEGTSKAHYSRAKEKLQKKLNITKEEYAHEKIDY